MLRLDAAPYDASAHDATEFVHENAPPSGDFERFVRRHAGPAAALARQILGPVDPETLAPVLRAGLDAAWVSGRSAEEVRHGAARAALDTLPEPELSRTEMRELLPAWDSRGRANPAPRAGRAAPTQQSVRLLTNLLPERERAALLLCDCAALPWRAAASILEVEIPALRKCLHEARLALRTLLESWLAASEQRMLLPGARYEPND